MFCSLKSVIVGSSLFALFFLPACFNTVLARGADRHVGGGEYANGGVSDFYGAVDSSTDVPGGWSYGSPDNPGEFPVYTKIDPNILRSYPDVQMQYYPPGLSMGGPN
jgi:hypothetical protein